MAGPTTERRISKAPLIEIDMREKDILHHDLRSKKRLQEVKDIIPTRLLNSEDMFTFNLTSPEISANSSALTTPQLSYNKEFSSTKTQIDKDSDLYYESDNTVIQYTGNKKYLKEADFEINPDRSADNAEDFENSTRILEGTTDSNSNSNLSVSECIELYIGNLIEYEVELKNEVQLLFDEFKFDIIANHLLASDNKIGGHNLADVNQELFNRNNISIQLSKTPYALLVHSIRPKLMSFSINCYLRKHLKSLKRKNTLVLLILSVSILNMFNNASGTLKFYSKMLICRTNKLISLFTTLERYFASCNIGLARNNSKRRITGTYVNKSSKLNLISSSIHFLISITVKRMEKLLKYGVNIGVLWKYLVVYELDGDFEEIKVVRNIIENPKSCACTWYNEPSRLLRTLKYVKKIFICFVMSSMEFDDIMDEDNKEKYLLFMKNFWAKFGFEEIRWNNGTLRISTKILGIKTEIEGFTAFIESFTNEILDGESVNMEDFSSSTGNEENYVRDFKLESLSERNEDDRIRELSRAVEQIAYKLDLIELGIQNEEALKNLNNDINKLVSCYNDVTTRKRSSAGSIANMDLKKLRMSEILLEEYEDDHPKKELRRSSGINVKLFSYATGGTDEQEGVEELDRDVLTSCNDEEGDYENSSKEFRRTLEKLCVNRNSNRADTKDVREAKYEEVEPVDTVLAKEDDAKFLEFKRELRQRLEREREG